jgi:metal-responsive CopG/Arc/MetJ family transcriptional regulator
MEDKQMPNMKTAISIEKPIFQQMDSLAKKLRISRSRLFAIAAQEFLQRNKNIDLLKSLNAAYDDLPETEPTVAKMRSTHYKIVKDQW